jgi:hypothetical protein
LDEFGVHKPERPKSQQRHRNWNRDPQDGGALVDHVPSGTDLLGLIGKDRMQTVVGVGHPLGELELIQAAPAIGVRPAPRPFPGRLSRPESETDLAELCGAVGELGAFVGCERKSARQAVRREGGESGRDDRRRPRLTQVCLGQTDPIPQQTGLRPMIPLAAAFHMLGDPS